MTSVTEEAVAHAVALAHAAGCLSEIRARRRAPDSPLLRLNALATLVTDTRQAASGSPEQATGLVDIAALAIDALIAVPGWRGAMRTPAAAQPLDILAVPGEGARRPVLPLDPSLTPAQVVVLHDAARALAGHRFDSPIPADTLPATLEHLEAVLDAMTESATIAERAADHDAYVFRAHLLAIAADALALAALAEAISSQGYDTPAAEPAAAAAVS